MPLTRPAYFQESTGSRAYDVATGPMMAVVDVDASCCEMLLTFSSEANVK